MGAGGNIKWWGTPQIHQVGFYEYGVSPFQLKTFKGFFAPGIFKLTKRTARQAAFIAPPALFFYWLASWADKKHEFYNRKVYLFSEEAQAEH
ncbi:ubiquinol--cytochrome-c reductase subunit 8 [Quaeritorhiza haematococci]|nr:ubiquinol--cytochrome-c reductase subunit 8 [Quaeritorhiza haematococci]